MKHSQWILCCTTLLTGSLAIAADSSLIELGIQPVINFDRDDSNSVPASETSLYGYGRTDTMAFNPDKCTAKDNCVSFEIEGGASLGLDGDADSTVWANFNIYKPFWGSEGIRRKNDDGDFKDGTFDPDYLPPLTFGVSSGFFHAFDDGRSEQDVTDWHITPFVRFHHWFLGGTNYDDSGNLDGYKDFTAEIGADFLWSDGENDDAMRPYLYLEGRWRLKGNPRVEFSLAGIYAHTNYDKSDLDADTLGIDLRARYHLPILKGDIGMYLDFTLGHRDVDGGPNDGSVSYLIPMLQLQYPADQYKDGVLTKYTTTSRSFRRGRLYR